MKYVVHGGAVFSFVDIRRNSTGYKNYLVSWFWLNFIAALPFGLLLANAGGISSLVCVAKVPWVSETLRYLRRVQAIRVLRVSRQAR